MNKKERHIRTEYLIGKKALEKLEKSKILVFGCGGVGGFVIEALARAGVGNIDIVDNDIVSESNINRQIIANYNTIGQKKTALIKDRIESLNSNIKVKEYELFYLPETKEAKEFDFTKYDYVIDAIDTTKAKIDIITRCKKDDVPIISSMGTGNKLDNTKFLIDDIHSTSICPLARVIRKELAKNDIRNVKVLYSKEKPVENKLKNQLTPEEQRTPGSISYAPATAGLLIAGEVIRDLIKLD